MCNISRGWRRRKESGRRTARSLLRFSNKWKGKVRRSMLLAACEVIVPVLNLNSYHFVGGKTVLYLNEIAPAKLHLTDTLGELCYTSTDFGITSGDANKFGC